MNKKMMSIFFFLTVNCFAASATNEKPGTSSNPPLTPKDAMIQKHELLAKLHMKAADCLRTSRTMDDCRNEMMKACPVGEITECKQIDSAELQRHRRTHEQAGIAGTDPRIPGIHDDTKIK